MKGLLFFTCLLPLQLLAQDLAGIWVGILHNDSTDLDLHYEIVISEKKGRLSGFSYTNFIVDGRSYTGVKSLVINQRFGKLYVEDDKLVYNNYDFEPPKGVKQASILELSDVEAMLSGRFVTSRTKQYGKPVTGHIYLLKKPDPDVSKLMEILNGLDLASNLSFIPRQPVAVAVLPQPKETAQPITKKEPASTTTSTVKDKPVTKPVESTKKEVIAVTPAPVKEETKTNTANKPKEQPVVTGTPATPVKKETAKPTFEQMLAARKVDIIQTIYFTSDSLVLELYDNGYVDGDSVSIVINGKALLTNIKLSEKAFTRKIHITPELGDSINLVMFAENLGTIAPNSGLAIIKDGAKQHRIAFSGDMKKNAGILLRRKKD